MHLPRLRPRRYDCRLSIPHHTYPPAWSPNALRIAFRRQTATGQPTQIWVVDLDGMNPVNLTSSAVFEYDPVWSPDGEWIAFTSERGGSQRVWIMRADGSHVVPVSPETYASVRSRSWR